MSESPELVNHLVRVMRTTRNFAEEGFLELASPGASTDDRMELEDLVIGMERAIDQITIERGFTDLLDREKARQVALLTFGERWAELCGAATPGGRA